MLTATDGVLRLIMCELVRSSLEREGEAEKAMLVRRVGGYREREVVRYRGTSSEWTEHYVDIGWEDWDGTGRSYEWRGRFAELVQELERLSGDY